MDLKREEEMVVRSWESLLLLLVLFISWTEGDITIFGTHKALAPKLVHASLSLRNFSEAIWSYHLCEP